MYVIVIITFLAYLLGYFLSNVFSFLFTNPAPFLGRIILSSLGLSVKKGELFSHRVDTPFIVKGNQIIAPVMVQQRAAKNKIKAL